jgi:hypothetical protein
MGLIDQLEALNRLAEDAVGISERQAEVDERQVAIAERGVAVLREAATIAPVVPVAGGTGPQPFRFARLDPISTGGGGEGGGNSRVVPGGQAGSGGASRSTGGGGEGGGNSRIPTGRAQPDPGSQAIVRAIGGLRQDVTRTSTGVERAVGQLNRDLQRTVGRLGSVDLRGEGLD